MGSDSSPFIFVDILLSFLISAIVEVLRLRPGRPGLNCRRDVSVVFELIEAGVGKYGLISRVPGCRDPIGAPS